ncbi:MAG: ABC transporter substrate-binding protein [Caldilineaceae bacterium]
MCKRMLVIITVLALLLAACVAPLPPAPVAADTAATTAQTSAAGDDATLTFVGWGGAYQEAFDKAYLNDYTADQGVSITVDTPPDPAKLATMVEAGQVTWDVIVVDAGTIERSRQYLEPLDYSVIAKDEILPGFADDQGVAVIFFAAVLGYNTETFPAAPQSWADFFDLEKFPGTRTVLKQPTPLLEIALVADGVPPAELYPLDVERALRKLDTIKDSLIFAESGAQSQQQLADGEAVMGISYNGRIQTAIEEGAPLAIQWNQQVLTADYLAVPKGAPHKEAAMKLIAYMTAADQNYKISDHIAYAPTNVKSFDKVNPEKGANLPTAEGRTENSIQISYRWWGENFPATMERFTQWLLE